MTSKYETFRRNVGRTSLSLIQIRLLNKNIPTKPVISPKPIPINISDKTVRHLERLSLVSLAARDARERSVKMTKFWLFPLGTAKSQ